MRLSRSVIAALALLVALGAGAAIYFLNSDNEDEGDTEANPVVAGAPAIYYVEGNVLKRIGPDEGDGEELAEGINAGADASPNGQHLAWVAYAGPDEPVTHLHTFGEEGVETISGDDPTWKSDDSAFAVVRPVGNTKCSEGECEGPVEVFTVDPDGQATEILNRGEWELLGWSGDRLIVGDAESPDQSFFVEGKNEVVPFDVPASEIRSVSPDGRWIVTQTATGPEMWSIDGDTAERSDVLGTSDETLTTVSWSEDSTRAAAISTTLEDKKIVVFDVERPVMEPVIDDLEPSGEVFWAPDNQGLVFTAVNRDDVQLEAMYCPLDGGDCSTYITWQSGTRVITPAA